MAESSPLPRYRRAEQGEAGALPKLLLQPRDLAILDDVWRYRWLTTSQIELLRGCDEDGESRFVSRLPLTRRLKLLFHHRYLQRIARPVATGSQEPVYVLDTEGAKALRRQQARTKGDATGNEVTARAPSQHPKPSALEHLLAVNQFRVSLVAACAASKTRASLEAGDAVELVNWLSSDAVKFSVPFQERGDRVRQLGLIPDGFFTLRATGRRLFYFLEVDLGGEPGKTLAEKCLGYYLYWQGGGFARDFSLPPKVGFRVTFVVPGTRRAETVLAGVRRLPGGQSMFWVTDGLIDPAHILKPIFKDSAAGTFNLAGVPAADVKI